MQAASPAPIWRPALALFVVLSLITGLAYPLLVTDLAQTLFPTQANGSLILVDGKTVGSALIGQPFSAPQYFWSRPSATGPMSHNAGASSGSNLGARNPALAEAVKARVEALRAADPGNRLPVPVDLVTASASGLDPHISARRCDYQVARVAQARGLQEAQLRSIVAEHSEDKVLGFLGEPRVNVLQLNLALDALKKP
ncbi:MAG: potassium-transporting ATPase subunit KdpC [Inhella sp.]